MGICNEPEAIAQNETLDLEQVLSMESEFDMVMDTLPHVNNSIFTEEDNRKLADAYR